MKGSTKFILAVLGVLILFAMAFFIFVALDFSGELNYPAVEITCSTSPDGKYEVVVDQLGTPTWSFGPVTARLTVKNIETGKKLEQVKFEVANDGTGLYESQFSFEWSEDAVKIVTDPAEAPPIEHLFPLTE